MLKPDFLFKQRITLERWRERGISADIYDDPIEIPCRVVYKRRGQFGGTKESVVASGTIFLPAGTEISPKDKVTLGGKRQTILSCLPAFDFDGTVNHVEAEIA